MLTRILLIGAMLCLALPTAASAHYKAGDPDDPSGWYFEGASTDKSDLTKIKDPINFIFYGGAADQSPYTRSRIEQHMADDWDTTRVGGRPWRKDTEIDHFCKVDQRAVWLGYPGQTSDRTDWHGSTSVTRICTSQTHARFWDDHEHAGIASGHGSLDQWVIGGIHHEHPIRKCNIVDFTCFKPGFTHRIDRDWDAMRLVMVRAMHEHCSVQSWKYVPGADGVFGCDDGNNGCFDNSGYLARLSLHHAAEGGCSGY